MAKRKLKLKKNRSSPTCWFIRTALFILVLRFSYVMITGHSNGQDLIMKANEKYLVKNSQQPERGKIYDRNGKVLAEDVERYKLVAVVDKKQVKKVKSRDTWLIKRQQKLAEIIDMDADEIEKRLNNKKAFQIEFGQKGTNLTYQEKEK